MKHLCRISAMAVLAVVLLGGIRPAEAGVVVRSLVPAQPALSLAPNASVAAAYCTSTGGVVEHRVPVFGTNNPQPQWLYLSGSADFCQYTLKKDGSRIHLLLTTLMATKPTLATLAYYAKVPTTNSTCPGGANPASCYCTYLGGSDLFGGANAEGGAWVLQHTTDIALEACVFPDMSSIDSWGLAYHANNITRGIDLSKVLKYHKT